MYRTLVQFNPLMVCQPSHSALLSPLFLFPLGYLTHFFCFVFDLCQNSALINEAMKDCELSMSPACTIFTCQLFTLTVLSQFSHSISRQHQTQPIAWLKGQLRKTRKPLFLFQRKSRRLMPVILPHVKLLVSFHMYPNV